MKVLVVLCAVVASCLAKPGLGYAYSAISPLTSYGSYVAPYSYAYSAPIISAPLAAPYAVPAAPIAPIAPIAPVAAVKTQYHSQDELGQASYGHSEPFQAHSAVQDAAGNKVGSYSYVDPHGAVHQTNYVADSLGYRVAANDLPVAPAGPGPVVPAETPEVVAAKAAHFAEHAAALSRARRSAYWGPQALPVVTPSGHLADTPEVAAAKAAHFAEHARQSGHAVAVPYAAQYTGHYAGPYAVPVVTPSGHLADTPEVAAAKAAHFAEHAKASGHAVAVPYAAAHYSGAYAAPVVTPSGHLADTPEVAAAKAAHFAEHAKQAGVAPVVPYSAYHAGHYAGPYATPVVTPSGHLADTPEVAAAKAAHFAEHAKQSGHAAYAVPYAAAHWTGYTGYAGPYAAPVVTPSGFLADTPEVAAAKHAHLAEHARRGKRSLFYQTPASTSPLAAPIVAAAPAVAYAAPAVSYAAAPAVYSAPAVSYAAAPAVYSAPALGVPAIKTDIVHTPGHAVSYRIDPVA
ncbi:unnamed protein product [Bemisia tabaci]|uniref:Cuticle protein n=1 Tax=Bemisia tabaci TaxID=7038 RepID=A0A9P0ACN5_BEMTA|nr:unnamed protein product [Bemisia tabaci]